MQGAVLAQKQQLRTIPAQIQANAILSMSALELQQFVDTEAMENPALAVEEKARCPVCGFLRTEGACPVCGAAAARADSAIEHHPQDERGYLERAFATVGREEAFDPFRTIAGSMDLRDHLKQQARMNFSGRRLRIAKYLVESLDDDGYFRESLYETAERFAAAAPEVESVLAALQTFDPPGIGARDLRECLLIQLRRLGAAGPTASNAERILVEHWEDFSKLKLKSIAKKIGAPPGVVREACEFVRAKLSPRPASAYRHPFQKLAPRQTAAVVPDVVVVREGDEFRVRVVDSAGELVKVDETYDRICRSIKTPQNYLSEEERRHVKEHVERVKLILEAIALRKKTLARVAMAMVEYQKEFLLHGPSHMRPLRQKDLAHELGLHESTICRAVANKHCRLPSGELVSFDLFFDCALPVREMISRLISISAEPISDGEIAKRLAEQGVVIARRTVAKYRDQLRLLPYQLRAA